MKLFLVMSVIVLSSFCRAEDVLNCSAAYATGLNHLFKGEARQLGEKEMITTGESASDELYTFTLSTDGSKSLKEIKSGKEVALNLLRDEQGVSMYATASLDGLYPDGVPGAYNQHKFIFVVCMIGQK